MDPHRAQRVSEALREELAELIGYELDDPRISVVDITEVQVAPDLRKATVRVALRGDTQEQQEALAALEHARHFLRKQLSNRLQLYRTPELHFEADTNLGSPERIEHLLRRIRKGRPRAEGEPSDAAGAPGSEKTPIE